MDGNTLKSKIDWNNICAGLIPVAYALQIIASVFVLGIFGTPLFLLTSNSGTIYNKVCWVTGDWGYVNDNYNYKSSPISGQMLAQTIGLIYIAIFVSCMVFAIKINKHLIASIITTITYLMCYVATAIVASSTYKKFLPPTSTSVVAGLLMAVAIILIAIGVLVPKIAKKKSEK